MLNLYLGLPLWYWIVVGIAYICIIVIEFLDYFIRYDVFVDNDFYRECTYKLIPRTNQVKIWSSDSGLFLVLHYNEFARVNSYWKWKKPTEEYYEKLGEELKKDVE